MKNVYVVLTAPRCGSSYITRGLQAIGIDLGSDLKPADPNNPTGYFEDKSISYINEKLNEYLIRCFNGEYSLDPLNLPIFSEACDLLNQKLHTNYSNFGFKDPRTGAFLPFWKKVFEELQLNANYIIAIRNPLNCAHSLLKSHNLKQDFTRACLIWQNHLFPAYSMTKNDPRIVIDYDKMLDNPRKQLERMSKKFGLKHLHDETEVESFCQEFTDISLQHHTYSLNDLESHQGMIRFCPIFYNFLSQYECDDNFDKKEFENDWQIILSYFNENKPLFGYIETLLSKCEANNTELQKTKDLCVSYEKSLSWRMTKPFRKMKQIFASQPQAQ